MMNRIAGRFLIVSMLFAAAAAMAPAQVPTGTINGIVSDPHDAVVGNAHVVVINKAQGVSRETSSNADGLYVFANLPAGTPAVVLPSDLISTPRRAWPGDSLAPAEPVLFNLQHDSTSEHGR